MLFLWSLLQFVGYLLKENKSHHQASGHKLGLQLISVVFLIVKASRTRWKRLNLLYFLSSSWQMSSVNKRTLSPSCAVNRICWSRLAAPCLSAEVGPRCRAPCTHPSFDKDEKLWREEHCFPKTVKTGESQVWSWDAGRWTQTEMRGSNFQLMTQILEHFASELKHVPQQCWQNPGSSAWAVFEVPRRSKSFYRDTSTPLWNGHDIPEGQQG